MPLKFKCSQDIRKMKSVKGKKFCEVCKHDVYDVRRKSVEHVIELKRKLGSCCVIINNSQLEEYDKKVHGIKKKANNFLLKTAAGLAAVSILPGITNAQTKKIAAPVQQTVAVRTAEGIVVRQKIYPAQVKKEIVLTGRFRKTTYGYPAQGLNVKIGYYAQDPVMGNLFYTYKDFEIRKKGKFQIVLSQEEYSSLLEHPVNFVCDNHIIEIIDCDIKNISKKIILQSERKSSHSDGRLFD